MLGIDKYFCNGWQCTGRLLAKTTVFYHASFEGCLFLVWDVQIQNSYHGAGLSRDSTFLHFQLGVWQRPLSMCCYTQFLTRTSTWDILSFILHIRRCSLLQDFDIWFHRVQTFFPNDTEPPPHSTSGSTHMKTDSCLTLHVFTRLLNSTQPLCRAFLFIAYNPLSASSLHPSYHGDLLSSGPLKQHHCSWWQPIPCVQLLSHPGGLSFIDPSSHLGLLLQLVVTSIF